MAHVHFTSHLRQFFELPDACDVEAGTVAALVQRLDERWPGLGLYVTDERGHLRQHVAVWVDGAQIEDRLGLQDVLAPGSEVHILQALSGG